LLVPLLLDLLLALAELDAPTSPACNGRMAIGSITAVKPAKRPIVPMTPTSDQREIDDCRMIVLQYSLRVAWNGRPRRAARPWCGDNWRS
jgi:hypothetical protein